MTAQVTIIGRLTKDPDLRFTASGDAVASFSVAVNERIKDGNEWKDGEPSYYEVKAWKKLGEQAAETLQKGNRVIVSGRMKIEKYEAKDGSTRYSTVVTADDIGKSILFTEQSAPMPRMTTREPDPWTNDPEGIPPF